MNNKLLTLSFQTLSSSVKQRFKGALALLFMSLSFYGFSQDILTNYEGLVDPLTGDFRWSQGLISIESTDGTSYPISIGYSAEVKTNQPASWVGLGWNLNGGEITRSVNGFPDDHKDFTQTETEYYGSSSTETTSGWGPMYFSDYTYASDHTQDVIYSTFRQNSAPTLTPAFDQFNMSTSFSGGSFKLDNYEWEENQLASRSYQKNGTVRFDDPDPTKNYNFRSFQMDNDPFRNTYIKYYTNAQIITIMGMANGSITHRDFVEYYDENGVAFDRSTLNQDAIGAFTVFQTDGTKLHFSLPVHEISSKTILLQVEGDGSLARGNADTTKVITKNTAVATSWKLTAITGPDHIPDTPHNVGDNDQGFWLQFFYAKWFDVEERTPEYGFNNSPSFSENDPYEPSRPFMASVSFIEKENYYLDRIESDREALIFYKSIRNDEYSNLAIGTGKAPALKVSKIIRYYKDDLSIVKSNTASNVSNLISLNSHTAKCNAVYLEEDYNSIHNNKVIKAVAFNYDYSLQPKYYRNIANYSSSHELIGASVSLPNYSATTIYSVPTTWSGTQGKLTLKSITPFENEFSSFFNPYQFVYASGSDNPDYHHWDADLTGNYMDITSRRQTRIDPSYTSSSSTDHWKLKEIQYPNDTKVKITYEMDQYIHKYIGFNDPGLIVPIKKITIDNAPTGSVGGRVNLTLDLFDASDKVLITAKANRRINLWNSITACSQVQITDPTYSGSGLITYDGSGNSISNKSSMYFVTNTDPNKITLNVPLVNLNRDTNATNQSDCSGNFLLEPFVKYAYFVINDPNDFSATHRVKEIKVYESPLATDHYSLAYTYESGYATNNLSDAYVSSRSVVNFGNRNTSFNSLPFNVLYKNTTIHKKGIDGNDFYSSKLTHHISRPFSFSTHFSNGHENKCFIPIGLTRASAKYLWEFMHSDDYEYGDLPELIVCGVRTYIEDVLIPGNPNLSPNDINEWENVASAIPDASLSSLGIVDLGTSTIHCSAAGVECGGKIVDNFTSTINGDVVDFFPFYTDIHADSKYITYKSEVTDLTTRLGTIQKVEAFDKDGNLVLETDYEYDIKAYTTNEYKAVSGYNTINASETNRTLFKKYYYYPKRKHIFSKGVRYVEEISGLHPKTGIPTRILYSDPSTGVSAESKGFLIDINTSSSSGGTVAARTQLGLETLSGNMLFPKRICWRLGETAATEYNDLYKNHNLLQVTYNIDNKLFGYRIGDYLLSGTNSLDKLSHTSAQTSFAGNILQRDDSYNYSSVSINTNVLEPFLPVAVSSEGYIENTKVSEQVVNCINHQFNPLETYDVENDVYAAIRYKLNGEWPFVSMGNCRLGSFTATGFEDQKSNHTNFEGEVTGSANRYEPTTNDITKSHTGKFVCRVNNASPEVAFKSTTDGVDGGVLETGRTYVTNVWVNNQSTSGIPELTVSLNGSNNGGFYTRTWTRDINHADNITIGDWTLIEVEFAILPGYLSSYPSSGSWSSYPDPELKISLTGMSSGYCYFDDFRFHPIESPMEVNIYDEQYARVTHVLDSRNQYTKLEYDLVGRIIRKIRESIHGVYTAEELTYND